MSRISRSAQKMWSLIGTDSRISSAFRAASHCRPNALLRSQYTRPARILEPGVGCSSWHHSQTRQRYTTAVGRGGEKSDDASGKPNLSGKDEDVVEFMEDEVDLEELEYDENSFTVDQSMPKERQRPKLPRSIKKLNMALGRKHVLSVPDHELVETFVRGRGPGGQAINKTNSSVSLVHVPTGIRIQSQPTRSREQNRVAARHILSERLDELRGRGLYSPEGGEQVGPERGVKVEKDDVSEKQLKRESKRQHAVALADAYTKTELRAAKERARKANRTKKHKQKKRRLEGEGTREETQE